MAIPAVHAIRRISWQGFRVPFRESFAAANRTMRARDGLIIRVENDAGAWPGEASFLDSDGLNTVERAAERISAIGRQLLGLSGEEAWAALAALPPDPDASMRSAACGLETAVANLTSAQAGMSMAAYLRGSPSTTPATGIRVNGIVPAGATEAAIEAARGLVADGMTCLKLKVGGDPEQAVAHLARVRAAVGDAVELRADANGSWMVDEAARFLGGCQPIGLALCEEPLSLADPERLRTLAALRKRFQIPLGVDESCRLLSHFDTVLAAAATDVLVLKPMATGLHEAMRMMQRAGDCGVPVVVTTTFDGGLGTLMAAHVAAARTGTLPACGLATLDFLNDDLVTGPLTLDGDALALPTMPGLGGETDMGALRRYGLPVSGSVER
ncbi:MAG: hypothetical protein KC495_03100 [Dehalococcoidia bacterium]|nr:hypothetical protein [Dehalococcoidia bacterium]MCB9486976.1 hypothetical protein [Thermoflexaceae bacterium]